MLRARWLMPLIFFSAVFGMSAHAEEIWEPTAFLHSAALEPSEGTFHPDGDAELVWYSVRDARIDENPEILTLKEEGRNRYYFQGFQQARRYLEAPVLYHLESTRGWWAEEGSAEALFTAALFYFWTLLDGEAQSTDEVARQLAIAFPGREVDRNAFPPRLIEKFEAAREGVENEMIEVNAQLPEDCRMKLNGAPTGSAYRLYPERTYLVTITCPTQVNLYWVQARRISSMELVR